MQARALITPSDLAGLIAGKSLTINLPEDVSTLTLETNGKFIEFLRLFLSPETPVSKTPCCGNRYGRLSPVFGNH